MDVATEALKTWQAWGPAAEHRVVNSFLDEGIEFTGPVGPNEQKAESLVRAAYFAGLQSWVRKLLAIHVHIETPLKLEQWCQLQFLVLKVYPSAHEYPNPRLFVDTSGRKGYAQEEATALLDRLVSGVADDKTRAIRRLKEIPDLLPKRRRGDATPSESECAKIIETAWDYARWLGCDCREPSKVKGLNEVRGHLDELMIWCRQNVYIVGRSPDLPTESPTGLQTLSDGGPSITGQKPASVPSPADSAPQVPVTTQSESGAAATWKEKLEYFQQQQAITADPAQKFGLKKQIEEAKRKIRELGG